MAELATLARPYASAAFDIAKDQNQLDRWSDVLRLLTQTIQVSEVRQLIESPVHSPARKALGLTDLLGDQLTDSMRRFIQVLADNRRLELIPQVREAFEVRLEEERRTLAVEVTAAVELSDSERQRFEDALRRRFERDINLSSIVDPSVLGGALIRAGDTVLDGTVRGKLEKLRAHMQRA